MPLRIAVDTGGTFTDFVVIDDAGEIDVFKVPGRHDAPDQAVVDGIEQLARARSTDVNSLLADVELFLYGTTIGTNTVIERNGPPIGILHTSGFRDILELRDGHKPDRYNLHLPPPDPLIPRHRRLGVEERVIFDGSIHRPLDEQSVRSALAELRNERVESVAVCLLWSSINPAHEIKIKELIAAEVPSMKVWLSSEILPSLREYPRACATALSAYVGPTITEYLDRVAGYLAKNGYAYDMLVMQVNGGSAAAADIARRPVLAIGSGPAAGPAAGVAVGEAAGARDLMVVDMGGTSFEVSVVTDGQPTLTRDARIANMPIGVAAVDIHSIGAGGGSIAWIDSGGMLRVGPQSAGASPGPACYGHGGQPTVTDANVILGYLDPDYFLGGRIRLDPERSRRALEPLAAELALDTEAVAAAIYRVVNTAMVGAMRAVSVMRGVDPRRYTLIIGGGAGGAHAAPIARELGVTTAICPTVAGGLCAYGMLAADVTHSYLTTQPANTADFDIDGVNLIYDTMEQRALSELSRQGFTPDRVILTRSADAKYPYQTHELMIPVPSGMLDASRVIEIATTFHQTHERLYSYSLPEMSVDVTGWRLTATGTMPALPLRRPAPASSADPSWALKGSRLMHLGRAATFHEVGIYDGGRLQPGMTVEGPAVAEFETTTLVLFEGDALTVNPVGDLEIALPTQPSSSSRPELLAT